MVKRRSPKPLFSVRVGVGPHIMLEEDLVYIDTFGLLGANFYWNKYEDYGLTKEDILSVGLTSDRVQVHKDIIGALINIDNIFKTKGYRLYIKEGYRSKALYEMIYKRRVEKFGKEKTDRLLNMGEMPHVEGKSVDVALWDIQENKEIYMRRFEDGTDALFVDFYKNKKEESDIRYQELQEWVIGIMQDNGFRLGIRREYFHFNYRPSESKNYPK